MKIKWGHTEGPKTAIIPYCNNCNETLTIEKFPSRVT